MGGQFVSLLGTFMTNFALTIWAWQVTGEATALAMVGLAFVLPNILPTGYSRMFGKAKASPTIARAVASPVTCHAQIVRAKFVMKVPRRLTNWPPQITVNPRIPERKGCLLDSVDSINTC